MALSHESVQGSLRSTRSMPSCTRWLCFPSIMIQQKWVVLQRKQDVGSTLVPKICPKWHIPKSMLSMFSLSIPHVSDSAVSQKLVSGGLQIFLERRPRASSVRLPMSTRSLHFICLVCFVFCCCLYFAFCFCLFFQWKWYDFFSCEFSPDLWENKNCLVWEEMSKKPGRTQEPRKDLYNFLKVGLRSKRQGWGAHGLDWSVRHKQAFRDKMITIPTWDKETWLTRKKEMLWEPRL